MRKLLWVLILFHDKRWTPRNQHSILGWQGKATFDQNSLVELAERLRLSHDRWQRWRPHAPPSAAPAARGHPRQGHPQVKVTDRPSGILELEINAEFWSAGGMRCLVTRYMATAIQVQSTTNDDRKGFNAAMERFDCTMRMRGFRGAMRPAHPLFKGLRNHIFFNLKTLAPRRP